MREKYESLALADLKAIARTRGIKGTSLMKKAEVLNAMLELDAKESADKASKENEVSEAVVSKTKSEKIINANIAKKSKH